MGSSCPAASAGGGPGGAVCPAGSESRAAGPGRTRIFMSTTPCWAFNYLCESGFTTLTQCQVHAEKCTRVQSSDSHRLNTPVCPLLSAKNNTLSRMTSFPALRWIEGFPRMQTRKVLGKLTVGRTNSWALRGSPRILSPTKGKGVCIIYAFLSSLNLFLKIRNGCMLGFLSYTSSNLYFLFLYS